MLNKRTKALKFLLALLLPGCYEFFYFISKDLFFFEIISVSIFPIVVSEKSGFQYV